MLYLLVQLISHVPAPYVTCPTFWNWLIVYSGSIIRMQQNGINCFVLQDIITAGPDGAGKYVGALRGTGEQSTFLCDVDVLKLSLLTDELC